MYIWMAAAGGRWSRIAQHLPGRTDNEIKNYWRTRVQKQARQLRVDANSAVFRDAVRCYWMPRLLEKMAATSSSAAHHGELLPPPPLHHPSSHIPGMASSPSPIHGSSQPHDASTNAPAGSAGYGHHRNNGYPVDPSPPPSTSTSGSVVSTPAALPPVPCFSSELTWADVQYGGPYYADLDGAAGAFDSVLGLDGLDLGPADDCDAVYSDSTLLDYLNSTCAGGGTMMGVVGGAGNPHTTSCGGGGAMVGSEYGYGSPSPSSWRATDELYYQAAARKLGDHHHWGGGI